LETYEAERQPVAKVTVEQAYARYVTRTAPYLDAKGFQPIVPDFNIELGYLYRSRGILDESGETRVHEDPHQTCGLPGSRAPHVWVQRNGRSLSTLDLFGRSFVLLTGSQGEAWHAAARTFAGLDLDCYRIDANLYDRGSRLALAYGLSSNGVALVRLDGFVGWR